MTPNNLSPIAFYLAWKSTRLSEIRNALSKMPDVLWLSIRYSRCNQLHDTFERSACMLRNFFANEAGRGVMMLAAIYAVVITVVAGLMRIFGL